MQPPPGIRGRFLETPAAYTAGVIVLTIACTAAVLVAGMPLGVLVSVLLVYAWRRFAGRTWSGVGLRWTWSAPLLFLLGTALSSAALVAANAAAVAAGAAAWVRWEPDNLLFLPVAIAIIIAQAFPEELIWRGNLHDFLAERLSQSAIVLISSVFFGALHFLSQSEAEGAVEKTLYAVGAVALGFVCAVSREKTGTLWMPIGVHSGFYVASGFFPTESSDFGVQLVAQIAMTVLAGLVLLIPARWWRGSGRAA